jgi:hypothetical protein
VRKRLQSGAYEVGLDLDDQRIELFAAKDHATLGDMADISSFDGLTPPVRKTKVVRKEDQRALQRINRLRQTKSGDSIGEDLSATDSFK